MAERRGFEPPDRFYPVNRLAGGCLQPLGHLSARLLAEGVGFEPTEPCGSAVFKTAALNHSAIPPRDCRAADYCHPEEAAQSRRSAADATAPCRVARTSGGRANLPFLSSGLKREGAETRRGIWDCDETARAGRLHGAFARAGKP